MISNLEKRILRDLQIQPIRKLFARDLYSELTEVYNLDLDRSFLPALEYLLAEIDPENPIKMGVLVSGSFDKPMHRCAPKTGKYQQSNYMVAISGHNYCVHSSTFKRGYPKAPVAHVDLSLEQAVVTFRLKGREYRRAVLPAKGAFRYTKIKKLYYENCLAIEVRPVPPDRKMRTGSERRRISLEDRGGFIIQIHHEGETYMYNLFKEMVFHTLSKEELKRQGVLRKTAALQEKADCFDRDSYLREVRKHMLNRWMKKPREFQKEGRTIFIEGSWDKRLDCDGMFLLDYFEGRRKKKKSFVVGDHYARMMAHAEFKGPYVFFYDDGEILNGHRTRHIGFECKRPRPTPQDVEYVRVKTVKMNGEGIKSVGVITCIENQRYVFHKSSVQRIAQIPLDDLSCGLMYHRPREGEGSFTLLVKTEEGLLEREIHPDKVCPVKK